MGVCGSVGEAKSVETNTVPIFDTSPIVEPSQGICMRQIENEVVSYPVKMTSNCKHKYQGKHQFNETNTAGFRCFFVCFFCFVVCFFVCFLIPSITTKTTYSHIFFFGERRKGCLLPRFEETMNHDLKN